MKILQEAIYEYQLNMHNMQYPPCFQNNEKFQEWCAAENDAKTEPRKFVCRDCTASYQKRMVAEDRCLIAQIPVMKIVR